MQVHDLLRQALVCFLSVWLTLPALGQESPGQAVVFNGANFVRSTKWSPDLFPTDSFTFQLWFKATGPGVLISETDTADVRHWEIAFAEILPGGVLKAGAANVPAFTVGNITLDTWHHLTLVCDGPNERMEAYLDGRPSGSGQGNRRRPEEGGRSAVYPFGRGGPRNLGGGAWFRGQMDEVRTWNIALSPEEAVRNWRTPLGNTPTGLVGYWKFNSTEGSLSPDSAWTNPALHVPVEQTTPLMASTAPIFVPEGPVATLPAIVSPSATTLRGSVGVHPGPVEVFFEWGQGFNLDQATSVQTLPGTTSQAFSAKLRMLPEVEHRFRAVARTATQTNYGEVFSFTPLLPALMAAQLSGTNYFRTTLWSDSSKWKNESFTWELWFMAETPGVLVGETDTAEARFWDYAFAEVLEGGALRVGLPGTATMEVGTISMMTWYHLAFSYDDATDTLTAYLNGELKGNTVGNRQHPHESGRKAVHTFGRGGPKNLGPGAFLKGRFDEVRIWNAALAHEVLAAQWQNLIAPVQTSLIGYWRFDEASGNLVADLSGSGNPALYVPVEQQFPLVKSGARVGDQLLGVITETAEVGAQEVVLRGKVNPRGAPATAAFAWGTTEALGQMTEFQAVGSGEEDVLFSAALPGLAPGEYFYSAVGKSGAATIYGEVKSFTKFTRAMRAAYLDGQYHIQGGVTSADLRTSEDLTIEFWLNPEAPGIVLGEFDALDTSFWEFPLVELEGNPLALKVGIPGGGRHNAGTIPSGQWTHVALVYNEKKTQLAAYVNGEERVAIATPRTAPWEHGRTARYSFGRGVSGKEGFHGQLDEIRIWSRAVSAEEIEGSYTKVVVAGLHGLLGYWKLDAVANGSFPDASEENNAATIQPSASLVQLRLSNLDLEEDLRPILSEEEALDLNPFTLMLLADVDPNGFPAMSFIEFGDAPELLQEVERDHLDNPDGGYVVYDFMTNLVPGKTYYFRFKATNQHGVVVGPVLSTVKSGWGGLAPALSGTTHYVGSAQAQSSRLPSDDLTVEFWFNTAGAGVLGSEVGGGADRSYAEVLPSGSVEVGFEGMTPFTAGHVETNKWYHLALRYDSAAQRMDAFINGVKSGQSSVGPRTSPVDRPVQTFFAFGRSARTRLGTGLSLPGRFDEIRWWSVPRTDQEIASSYNRLLKGNEPGLVAYWNMDEPAGNVLNDSSGNENHGVITGGARTFSTAPITHELVSIKRTGNKLDLEFLGILWSDYALEMSSDLSTWSRVSTNEASSTGLIQFQRDVNFSVPAHFFRAVPLEDLF